MEPDPGWVGKSQGPQQRLGLGPLWALPLGLNIALSLLGESGFEQAGHVLLSPAVSSA